MSDESPAPLDRRPGARGLLTALAVLGGAFVLYRISAVVVVLVLAVFFAYVIAPIVDLVQHRMAFRGRARRLPRWAAVAVVYLMLGVVASGLVAALWPTAAAQLNTAIASVPAYAESFRTWEHGWTRYYERLRIPVELRHVVDESVLGAGEAAVGYARGSLVAAIGALSAIPWLVLVPVLAFLLLKDASVIRRTLLIALPHRAQLRSHRLFEELNETLAAYVRAQLAGCAIVGVLCAAGFAALGSPYAILLGAFAAVLECVPLAGPFVVGVVAVTIAALHDPPRAVWTFAFLVVLRVVEDYVIYPRLIGRDIDLNPLVVILAVLAGAELDGIAGVFVAVPVVALGTVGARHWLAWRSREEPPASVSN